MIRNVPRSSLGGSASTPTKSCKFIYERYAIGTKINITLRVKRFMSNSCTVAYCRLRNESLSAINFKCILLITALAHPVTYIRYKYFYGCFAQCTYAAKLLNSSITKAALEQNSLKKDCFNNKFI